MLIYSSIAVEIWQVTDKDIVDTEEEVMVDGVKVWAVLVVVFHVRGSGR